jgi:uncharacterized protein (TIGR03435 family)
MPWLVDMPSAQTGHPVADSTGLTGKYEFCLSWIPRPPDAIAPEDSLGADLFAALQDQLSVKLEPKKAPIDVLVIDRAQKVPSDN